MNKKTMHGMTGKRNAAKLDKDKSLSYIHARCKASDKARWTVLAKQDGVRLTSWIIKRLND